MSLEEPKKPMTTNNTLSKPAIGLVVFIPPQDLKLLFFRLYNKLGYPKKLHNREPLKQTWYQYLFFKHLAL